MLTKDPLAGYRHTFVDEVIDYIYLSIRRRRIMRGTPPGTPQPPSYWNNLSKPEQEAWMEALWVKRVEAVLWALLPNHTPS